MTTIRCYSNDEELRSAYLQLVTDLYQAEAGFDSFFRELQRQSDPNNPTAVRQKRMSVAVMNDADCIAHASIIRDTRSPEAVGWFGFFECPDSQTVFDQLWSGVQKCAAELHLQKITGPINGTIWHPYRFVVTSDLSVPWFSGELICKPFYHKFFEDTAASVTDYYSARRTKYDNIITQTKPAAVALEQTAYRIKPVHSITTNVMKSVFEIARQTFPDSMAFVPLSDEELLFLYAERQQSVAALYLVYHDDQPVAFALCLRESATVLSIKTIAVLPDHQANGIGSALLHNIHRDATGHYQQIIYALIQTENNIKKLPQTDAEIIRTYRLYTVPVLS